MATLFEVQRKLRTHRRYDDAARRHRHEERAIGPVGAGPDGRRKNRQRAHDKNERSGKQRRAPAELGHLFELQTRRQRQEQDREQHGAELFLPLGDVRDVQRLAVGEHDAHHRHGEQPGLGLQHVGGHERHGNGAQRHRHVQHVRDVETFEGASEAAAGDQPRARSDRDRLKQADHDVAPSLRVPRDRVEHEQRQHGADRVDEDAFPAQDRAQRRPRTHVANQRNHDRRPREHENGANENGYAHVDADQVVGGKAREHPGDERADRDEVAHHLAAAAQFVETQGEPTFKQDDAHRQRHERSERRAKHEIRVEHARDRPREKAKPEQQQDRRQAKAPGDPLRERADPEE